MKTVRFEQDGAIGSIVLANPPFNRIDSAYATNLLDAVHRASESGIRVLVVRAEGQNFSFGGEVREWPGKDVNWFRTFVAEVNQSYRAIEALRVPTLASGASPFSPAPSTELTDWRQPIRPQPKNISSRNSSRFEIFKAAFIRPMARQPEPILLQLLATSPCLLQTSAAHSFLAQEQCCRWHPVP